MDALITVFAIVAALFVLDIAAVLFGADTRDDFGDDASVHAATRPGAPIGERHPSSRRGDR